MSRSSRCSVPRIVKSIKSPSSLAEDGIIYNEFTIGEWSISDAQIHSDSTIQFVTYPVKTTGFFIPFQTTQKYTFTGAIHAGKLSGTVIENNDGVQRKWTLNPDATNTCPY